MRKMVYRVEDRNGNFVMETSDYMMMKDYTTNNRGSHSTTVLVNVHPPVSTVYEMERAKITEENKANGKVKYLKFV